MANYSANDRSERILQNRRFTTDALGLSQEAFTSVLDISSYEIYTDDGLIPSASNQLPFSGSSQGGLIVSASHVDPTNYTEGVNDLPILEYYYRHRLKRGAATEPPEEQVFYFTEEEATTSGGGQFVSDNQLIESDQLTNFISPKYLAIAGDTVNVAETGNPGGAGYKVVVYVSDSTTASGITENAADPTTYVFDYKTGVLSWKVGSTPASTKHIYMTAYRYGGRTLRSQIDDGSIGGSDFTAAGISGSLGDNATLIRSLTAAGISGSFTATSASIASDIAINLASQLTIAGQDDSFTVGQGGTINFVSGSAGITVLSDSTDTITIGASTDNVTLNQITSSIVSSSGGFIGDVTGDLTGTATKINLSDVGGSSELLPVILSKETSPNNTIGYRDSGLKLLYNPGTGKLQVGDGGIQTTYGTAEIQGGSGLGADKFKFHTDASAVTKIEIGAAISDVIFGDDVYISGSLNASTDLSTFALLNTNTTTINFGGAATALNIGNAAGTVNIAGSASIAGDLTVQGTVTSIETENLNISDQFILLASGSTGTKDGGIIVQSGSNGVGTALYFDANANRWAVNPANTVNWNDTSLTPKQYVVSVSASAAAPLSTPLDFGDSSEYYGMMHVNTDNGEIYIYS